MDMLDVCRVRAGYGDTEILKGVSLHFEKGEMVAIIGPNGSGKSTLLKSICGLVRPKKGSVVMNGVDITRMRPYEMARMGMGYVPQTENIFPSLTVRENLEMGAYTNAGKLGERVRNMYDMFPDIYAKRNQKAESLSGGQRQMLAFARALMPDPAILLLDEPSAGLSPVMASLVFSEIEKIHTSGVAIIMVEQNAKRALGMADRAYVLVSGENRLEGNARDLLNDPDVVRLYLGGAQ